MGVWTIVRIVNNRFTLSNPFIDEAEGSEEKAINEIRWGISFAENIGALDIIANKGGRSLTAFGEKILEMEEAEAIELLRDLNTSQKNISSLDSVLSLGEELLFDSPEFFVEVAELLEDRPQAIFYGPPGTVSGVGARRIWQLRHPRPYRRFGVGSREHQRLRW